MPTLSDLDNVLKGLWDELYMLRTAPRPVDRDWREDANLVKEARQQNRACVQAADACLRVLDETKGLVPETWLGSDPAESRFIRLHKALETARSMLPTFSAAYGYKMPLADPLGPGQVAGTPEDVARWAAVEGTIRELRDELADYVRLSSARETREQNKVEMGAGERDGVREPESLAGGILKAINCWIADPARLEFFRLAVPAFANERRRAEAEAQRRLRAATAAVRENPRLRDEKAGPPGPGWQYSADLEGDEGVEAVPAGWYPPGALDTPGVLDWEDSHQPTVHEMLARLAAFHDGQAAPVRRIIEPDAAADPLVKADLLVVGMGLGIDGIERLHTFLPHVGRALDEFSRMVNEPPQRPTAEDLALTRRIGADIKARSEFYRPAGEWLDAEFSEAGMKAKGLAGGERPLIRWREALRTVEDCTTPTQTEAGRILLLVWLLLAPDAGAAPRLTEFQDWPWPETEQGKDLASRRYAADVFAYGDAGYRGLMDLARRAWLVVEGEADSAARRTDGEYGAAIDAAWRELILRRGGRLDMAELIALVHHASMGGGQEAVGAWYCLRDALMKYWTGPFDENALIEFAVRVQLKEVVIPEWDKWRPPTQRGDALVEGPADSHGHVRAELARMRAAGQADEVMDALYRGHAVFCRGWGLGEPAPKPSKAARVKFTLKEANVRVREELKKDRNATVRNLSDRIGCSVGLVTMTAAWKAVNEERRKRKKPTIPKAVSLTGKLRAKLPAKADDPAESAQANEELDRLVAEQKADGESDGSMAPFEPRGRSRFQPRRKA